MQYSTAVQVMQYSNSLMVIYWFCLFSLLMITEIYAWWNVPTKRFKICHISIWIAQIIVYETPSCFFQVFISCYLICSIINAMVFVDIDQKHSLGEKNWGAWCEKSEKELWIFIHNIRYARIWIVLLGDFYQA